MVLISDPQTELHLNSSFGREIFKAKLIKKKWL